MTIGCVVLDSCRVDKKSYDKQVVSGQLVYETGQKIINPIPPFIYKRVDPFITNVTRLNKHLMLDYARVNLFKGWVLSILTKPI